MNFLADMGISRKTVSFLKAHGYDAVHLHEQGHDRMPDSDILAKALGEKRIVLTHDLDFGDLMAASGGHLPSVIIFRLRNMKSEQVNRYLSQVISSHGNMLEKGALITVTEGKIRVRHLPIRRLQAI